MTRAALRRLLDQERVRRDSYCIDGEVKDECLCLLPEPGGWLVFYSERGGRTGTRHFETEDEACDYIATSMLGDSGTRIGANWAL